MRRDTGPNDDVMTTFRYDVVIEKTAYLCGFSGVMTTMTTMTWTPGEMLDDSRKKEYRLPSIPDFRFLTQFPKSY